MWFRKKNKQTQKASYRYSIGEKIQHYTDELSDKKPAVRRKAQRNLKRLKKYENGEKVFGEVFIVKDKEFYPTNDSKKPRQVVCVGVKNKKMQVIPVRKNQGMVVLSKFDNQRALNVRTVTALDLNAVYEKQGFKNTDNSSLTSKEKLELHRKFKKIR